MAKGGGDASDGMLVGRNPRRDDGGVKVDDAAHEYSDADESVDVDLNRRRAAGMGCEDEKSGGHERQGLIRC